ncbi:MAG: hypothetical protein Q9220_005747 [cf. Caloplaca sp. 1 TL-2023]
MPSSVNSNTKGTLPPSQSPPGNAGKTPSKFVRFWRRIYHPLGFQKGYNFILFFIFAGALLGFTLARLSYLNISGSASSSFANGSSPGEWYWSSQGIYRIGITIHLAAILPAGFLMIWQFVPIIRHEFLIVHRINGYLVILLVLVSNVGAVMITRRAFGGSLSTQAGVGVLAIISTVSIGMAYYNIKRLQIDQHRAWMLRAMFYLGTIITLRLIMVLAALVASSMSGYYVTMTCGEIFSIFDTKQEALDHYAQCGQSGSTLDTLVIVQATFANGQLEQIAASLRLSFGMALWMALFLHAVGVEIYLNLTPRESNRLRQVSYERQMEKGLTPFGSAGLTSDRWGDAEPWKPSKEETIASPGQQLSKQEP